MSFSCAKRIVYVPDSTCEHSLKAKDAAIEQLLDELSFKDEQLRDCLRMLEE